jgi:hypothetical protein
VVAQYFGQLNTCRTDRWVFGDRDSGAFLVRFGWTKIVRRSRNTHSIRIGGARRTNSSVSYTPTADSTSSSRNRAQHF